MLEATKVEGLNLVDYSKEELVDFKEFLEISKKLAYKEETNLPDTAFAVVVDKNGTKIRKYPINGTPDDETRVRAALRYLGMPRNQVVLRKLGLSVGGVLKKVLARAKELGMTDLLKRHNSQMGTPKTDEERAQNHFKISSEDWAKLAKEKQAEYISQLPKRGSGLAKSILRKAAKKLMDSKKIISTKDNEISLSKSKLEKFTKGIKTLANKIREGKISTQAKDLEISNLKVELEKSKLAKEEPIKSAIEEPKLETASLNIGDVRADGDASSQRIKKIREQSSAYLNPVH